MILVLLGTCDQIAGKLEQSCGFTRSRRAKDQQLAAQICKYVYVRCASWDRAKLEDQL